jgi:hypothetical protein
MNDNLADAVFGTVADLGLASTEPTGDTRTEHERLRAQLAQEEQRLHLATRAAWEAEAAEHFPFADVEAITEATHRGFIRAAKASHDRTAARVEQVVGAINAETAAIRQAAREQAQADERAAAAAAWGTPVISAGGPPPAAANPGTPSQRGDRITERNERVSLEGAVREFVQQERGGAA